MGLEPFSKLKVVAFSDTHGKHRKLNHRILKHGGDLLIFAGDVCSSLSMPQGTTLPVRTKSEEIIDFINWMKTFPFTHKFLIAGNHDYLLQYTPSNEIFTKEIHRQLRDAGITYLENSGKSLGESSHYIWGSPVTPSHGKLAFTKERGSEALENCWRGIPKNTSILVTHGPMYGILDVNRNGKHVGCELLRDRLAHPDFYGTQEKCGTILLDEIITRNILHVFGHIHESPGVSVTHDDSSARNLISANVAVCDNRYNIQQEVTVLYV